MRRYYLHVRNGQGYTRDDEGEEFADLHAARDRAVESVRSIASEEVKEGLIDLRGVIEIADAQDAIVLVLPFGDAVTVLHGDAPPAGAAA